MTGGHIWYSEEGPGRAAAPPRPFLAVPNVTAHPSTASVPTSYYSMWHYNCVKPSLGMWRECHPTFQQLTKHCDYRSRHHSVDDLTVIGSAALVAPATAGSTNSAMTISAHLLTYGEQSSSVVTPERRYGPRRLRDDDDDYNCLCTLKG